METAQTLFEKVYTEQGYAICCCEFPEKIGAILAVGDCEWVGPLAFSLENTPWRIIGTASKQEWFDWQSALGIRKPTMLFKNLYKIEAVD